MEHTERSHRSPDGAGAIGVRAWPSTVPAAFVATAGRRPDAVALRWRRAGAWDSWTWREYAGRVARVATGLRRLGIGRGERIVLMTRNRPEFHVLDMAALFVGAVPVSVYNSSSADELRYVTEHSEAVLAVVEDPGYLGRFAAVRGELPRLRQLAMIADAGPATPGDVVAFEQLLDAAPADLHRDAGLVDPGDVATLIYTSGTTGPPKAVEITHANVAWTVRSLLEVIDRDLSGWQIVSFLPMAHVAERLATHYLHGFVGTEVTSCHDPRFILEYLREVRPKLFLAVPLVWSKAYASIRALAAADPAHGAQFDAALAVGRDVAEARAAGRPIDAALAARWAEADRLCAVVRGLVGMDRVELAVTTAAPIDPEVVVFFRSMGVPLSELYGLSETTGPLTWDPYRVRPGDVGHPLPGCEVRVDRDGEVLARGGNVCGRYYKDPARTAEAFDAEGWLHTGDLGVMEGGRLRLVGRKKDLIVTAGGENVSPSNIEAALRSAPLVAEACVVGDRRPYLVALVTMDPEALGAWAHGHDQEHRDARELGGLPELRAELDREVAEVNRRFGRAEQVRRVAIVEDDWSTDSGLVTPTMKVKREEVIARYGDRIEALYA